MGATKAHVLLISYPAQGHVAPFMKLSHLLVDHEVKVTFVITESTHVRMKNALPELGEKQHLMRLVSLPDGLESEDDRKDERKLSSSIAQVLPGHLEDLIKKANQLGGDNDQITCVITDAAFMWALEIAEKMRLKRAVFWTSEPGLLASSLNIPKLLEAGIIDTNGTPRKDGKIQLSPNLPPLSTAEFFWNWPENLEMQKTMFSYALAIQQKMKVSNWLLCHWFHDLHPAASDLLPNMLPIGPLLANEHPVGNLWREDLTCLCWLNEQPAGSVIYVAFGSTSLVSISQHQFDQIALGLELAGRPFLWVIKSDLTKGFNTKYPDGFANGKIVQWAPQEKVLAHPSVACFLTHCGWNSTLESLSNAVPFLCWPQFGDQHYVQSCICDGWKVGLPLKKDDNGIITSHEIKRKIEELFSDDDVRANSLKLKNMARESVGKGGSSTKNLEYFIEQIKH
ncbi:hypothetical protein ACB098_04G097400 [Castanea mollissima]|uniref:Glycosyltransferase n=1 Tax=Castanea mollissima TaxID=60419 RepID=A0A8J4QDY7_9ROSI|nr:hypothetical protein CMV_028356 [Castanea mollissima]